MKIRNIFGIVLGILTIISTIASICGIWGVVPEDIVWKLLGTFLVMAVTTMGLSRVTNTFFDKKEI